MEKSGKPLILSTAGVLVVCVGIPFAVGAVVWGGFTGLFAEYNELPECGEAVNRDLSPTRVYTDIKPPEGRYNSPEFGAALTVGDTRLTWYQGLSFSSETDESEPYYDTRVINADGDGYLPVPLRWVQDVAVSPDHSRAAVLKGTGNEETYDEFQPTAKLGLMDLDSGEIDWRKLPDKATDVAWSPVSDTILVSTQRVGEILAVDADSGDVETVELPAPHANDPAGAVTWTEDGKGFIVTDPGLWEDSEDGASTVMSLDGEAEPFPVVLDATEVGLSPSGELAELQTDGDLEPRIVDVETGESVLGEGFDGCSNFGNVYELQPKAWLDDEHLIVIEHEREWDLDKRWGEPEEPPRGDRLAVVDLDGRVTEPITEWGAPIPESVGFADDVD